MSTTGCHCGPGYSDPASAVKGPREKILYVICLQPNGLENGKPDYLATIDIDPESSDYLKIIGRTKGLHGGDEFHHFGWNTCSSCFKEADKKRDKLILPCLNSSRIYVLDTSDKIPTLFKVIEPEEMFKFNVSMPHTSHCLPNGDIMISTLGDKDGNAKGDFVLLDSTTWSIKGLWTKGKQANFGYDFWYQPYYDTLVSSEWAGPNTIRKGYAGGGPVGKSLNFYSWSKRTLQQTINFGHDGITPLEVRFLHNPKEAQGYVGCAWSSNVFRFYMNETGTWSTEKVIDIPDFKVEGWLLPKMQGLITDILISMDDRFLYLSNWIQGDVRQYDISNRSKPVLVGKCYFGGSLPMVKVLDSEKQFEPVFIKGIKIEGGPQMLQLSLDGKRLYVTTSLFSIWDKQFYPDLIKNGSVLLKMDVDTDKGGLTLDEEFLVNFGTEPDGPVLAHECRYPGGDCTSDIFVA